MTALAKQPTLIHDAYAIRSAHRRKPMRNNQHRHLSFEAGKRLANVLFTLRIQSTSGFIQQ